MNIKVFNEGECIGILNTDRVTIEKIGAVMSLHTVTIEDFTAKEVDILYVKDMNYGIVIPKNIADNIRKVVDGE